MVTKPSSVAAKKGKKEEDGDDDFEDVEEEVSADDWEDCDVEDAKDLPPLENVGAATEESKESPSKSSSF